MACVKPLRSAVRLRQICLVLLLVPLVVDCSNPQHDEVVVSPKEAARDAPSTEPEEALVTANTVTSATAPEAKPENVDMTQAGVCSRCHVVSVLEWDVSAHVDAGTTCQECHGDSAGHVKNERNEVKPDRLPRGDAIAGLCSDCHEDGCPSTLEASGCQGCHHVHALVDPTATGLAGKDQRLTKLFGLWEKFNGKIAAGERHVKDENWQAALAEFQAALQLIPSSRDARARADYCKGRMTPDLPGFMLVESTAIDSATGLPREVEIEGLDIGMVLIPPGEFDMGADGLENSRPVHTVRCDAFYLGKYEVTQAQWTRVMGANPSAHNDEESANLPVEQVSWEDCQAFVDKLNERIPGAGFRLPTEAEWEYACRSGTNEVPNPAELSRTAWFRPTPKPDPTLTRKFEEIEAYSPQPVGMREPNAWGVHDSLGNVWEWCSSLYRPYLFDPTDGREARSGEGLRVIRGGSYADPARVLQPALRHGERPHRRYRWNGLRLARSIPSR